MISVSDLKNHAKGSNIEAQVAKLKPEHWAYAERLLSRMAEPTEAAMNDAWARMPRNERPALDDKKARFIDELISRFISKNRSCK